MEYEDVEEPCCGNCAKLTECFGVDIDIEDPYENLLDYCLAYQEIKNEDNRIEMNKRKELLIEALDKDKKSCLSGELRPILRYRRSNYDSVKGYSWIDFYLNDSSVPLFCTKTYKEDWHAFSEGILDEMQKVAMKWKTMNS